VGRGDYDKASLHHHFASKAELGCALIVRYTQGFCAALARIDIPDPQQTLRKYVQLLRRRIGTR
jgi:TetR/AcrR family transcriptional regulator, transcriptional repressor for nem operon